MSAFFLCVHVCVFVFVCLSISVCVCLEVSKADILAGCSVSETTSLESRSGSATVFAETQARIEIDEFHCKARSSRRISEYLRISKFLIVFTKRLKNEFGCRGRDLEDVKTDLRVFV